MSQDKLIAAAIARLSKLEKVDSFDPALPGSVPTEKQLEFFKDIDKYQTRVIRAGNRCLAEGTLVLTPEGPRTIQSIKPGDKVYSQKGEPITVKASFRNGIKTVTELTNRYNVVAEATESHVFLTNNNKDYKEDDKELAVSEFKSGTVIKRIEVDAPLGNVDQPDSYAIGALLGDGCCRQGSANRIYISSSSDLIPNKVASLISGKAVKSNSNNHTYALHHSGLPTWYKDIENKYAHEKSISIDIVKSWNRKTLIKFIAGILDTDGSVYMRKEYNTIGIQIGMQALPVIEAVQYAFLALWQIQLPIHIDNRDKYRSGPVYCVKISNNEYCKRILKELDPEIVTPSKKYKDEYNSLLSAKSNINYIGIKKGRTREVETYDIHVDSPENLYLLANGLVTHNSGKSAAVAREVAWILTGTHPYFTKPESWENSPLLILVAGQDRKMMEIELWSKKLALFLELKDWKQVRVGGSLQYVENRKTGDKIVFLSHADSSDKNRKHMQGYTAHYVWLDEMPSSVALLQEIRARASTNGIFVGTFTPKFRSDEVRQVIDGISAPSGKIYRFSMLDNPMFSGRKESILAELEGYSEAYKNSVLYGEWYAGDTQVYAFDRDMMVREPEGYSRAWPHVESVDPAVKSKFGYTLWAQEPSTGIWYLIKDEYIEGVYSPDDILKEVRQRSAGYNIVRRVCDPHESWYLGQASKEGIKYMTPFNKNSRKEELIKGLQLALSRGTIKITPWCSNFLNEISSCQWSERGDKIVNSSSYHTLDCSQYFVDCMPREKLEPVGISWEEKLRRGNHARKLKEHAEANRPKNGRVRLVSSWGTRNKRAGRRN